MKELAGIITGFILVSLGLIGWFTRPEESAPRRDYDGLVSNERGEFDTLSGTPSEYDNRPPFGSEAPDEKK